MDLPPGFEGDEGLPPGFEPTAEAVPQEPKKVVEEKKETDNVLPPKYLRRIIRNQSDVTTNKKHKAQRTFFIGALKYFPHAMYKLLENIPMPWEASREVRVLYHVAGAITIIEESPSVVEPVYIAQWGSMWTAMRRGVVERPNMVPVFNGPFEPPFKNDQPWLDYVEDVMPAGDAEPLLEELDPEGDDLLIDWFYSRTLPAETTGIAWNEQSRRWSCSIPIMNDLYRMAEVLLPEHIDRNYYYLFEKKAFMTAKALRRNNGDTLRGAPIFRLLRPNEPDPYDDDWTEFNDLNKVIVRQPIDASATVAFPFLYSREIRDVTEAPYHYPAEVYVRDDDPDRDAFLFNPVYNRIKGPKPLAPELTSSSDVFNDAGEDLFDLDLPDGFAPMFEELPLEEPEMTKAALALAWAPEGFRRMCGKTKRRVDIPLIDKWYRERVSLEIPQDVRLSYKRLLKECVLREKQKSSPNAFSRENTLALMAKTKVFQRTKLDWLEASMQLLRQGHTALDLVLKRKALAFVHLDNNFNLQPTRTLTTKERKKSRLGQSFHLIREILALLKYITDVHVKFRLGHIDAHQLADALQFLFTHVINVAAIHRYKYRVKYQVRQAKDLHQLIAHRFFSEQVPEGPGMGFWAPVWRVWVFFLRGMTPLLHRYLSSLVDRMIEGRKVRTDTHHITKQRVESNFNLNYKRELNEAVEAMLPPDMPKGEKERQQKKIAKTSETVFRYWKSGSEWNPPAAIQGTSLEAVIRAAVKRKSDWYIEQAHLCRLSVQQGLSVDKNMFAKNLGKLTRLKVMQEKARQEAHTSKGSKLTSDEAVAMLDMFEEWVASRKIEKIKMPEQSNPAEVHLLKLSLTRLNDQHNVANRLTQAQREEMRRIESAFDNPHEELAKIRDNLARKRIFKPINLSYQEHYSHLIPQYHIDPQEKVTDAFLDSYLWYECQHQKRRLFPNWVKPSDDEPIPVLVHRWADGINNLQNIWETSNGERLAMVRTSMEDEFYDLVAFGPGRTLFRRILELLLDETLVDYIVARHDVDIVYKDMMYHHTCGIIRGTYLAPFLSQVWGLMVDLLLLGRQRAAQLAGTQKRPNPFLKFKANPGDETAHPIRAYCRHLNTVYMVLRFTREEGDEMIRRFQEENPEGAAQSLLDYKNKKCWPRNCRMRLWAGDVKLGRAVLYDLATRLPAGVGSISWDSSFVSIYSADNPNLLYDMAGFDVRIQPAHRVETSDVIDGENVWELIDQRTNELSARAFVQVSEEHVVSIKNRVRRGLMSVGAAPFLRVAQKWNSVLTDTIPYYREAILGTEGLQETLIFGEKKMQSRIMMSLNSKMPDRFPSVIFFSPTDVGGLGMLSVSKSLVAVQDAKHSRLVNRGIQAFAQTRNETDSQIPNLITYYTPWETEMRESKEAFAQFNAIHIQTQRNGTHLKRDDVEDILDKGIPRIRLRFAKERELYAADRGFRVRREMAQFVAGKPLKYWWFHEEHDGRLCSGLERYRKDMIQALGGVEAILEHSLFKGTGFPSWEGLNWKRTGSFEDSKKNAKLTKAQAGGLTEVPNRRFALWWSPTINRQNVYAGFQSQIQLTGIKMWGKLELVKVPLIALFNEHLWEKIHSSVVTDIASALNKPESRDALKIADAAAVSNHPTKSFTLDHSAADIVLQAADRWEFSEPSLLIDADEKYRRTDGKVWIDIQLRWGNYDAHNIAEYARSRFNELIRDRLTTYPCRAGIVVAIDLAYNCHSAFGYWFPGLKDFLDVVLQRVMKNSPALFALRSRMKRSLQLYSSDPTEAQLSSTNISELFSDQMRTLIIDDTKTVTKSEHATQEGNRKFMDENGAVSIFDPRTGIVRYCVIHKSVFRGKKRKEKLSRDKAAEVVAAYIKQLPPHEQPKQIICLRSKLQGPLSNALFDFKNIVIRSTELSLPLALLHMHPALGERRTTATESVQYVMSAYDDWSSTNSPSTCFKRLIMVLRGYHVNIDRTRQILQPSPAIVTQSGHFWPTLETDFWIQVEHQLHDMILEDYARAQGTSVAALTQREREDIMLGKRITSVELQQDETLKLEAEATKAKMKTVTQINKAGEIVKRRVAFSTEGAAAEQWRRRAIVNSGLSDMAQRLRADNVGIAPEDPVLVFPTGALRRFFQALDASLSVTAFMLGCIASERTPNVIEVRALIIPKQKCALHQSTFPIFVPAHNDIEIAGLSFVGTLRSECGEPVVHNIDLAQVAQLRKVCTLPPLRHTSTFSVIVGLKDSEPTMRAFSLTEAGLEAGEALSLDEKRGQVDESHVGLCQIRTTSAFGAFFLIPFDGWNCTHASGTQLRPDEEYPVGVSVPKEFFAPEQHIEPFRNAFRDERNREGDNDPMDEENF